MHPPSWTNNRVHKLRRLIEERYSAGDAAAELRVTRSAALGKAMALGLHFQSVAERPVREKKAAAPGAVDLSLWRKMNQPPIPLPDLRSIETAAHHRPLAECAEHECTWPMSEAHEPGSASTPLCCAHRTDSSPYCPEHHRLSLQRYALA